MDVEKQEREVIAKLVRWADQHPLIRALVLESSRANPGAPLDIFSDYDLLLIVSSPQSFVDDDQWLHAFGTPLVRFNDQGELEGLPTYNRLVLYEDGTKIDYILWPVAALDRVRAQPALPDLLDLGYRVLVDKDSLLRGLAAPSYTAHIPAQPTQQDYTALVEEFWWESTYVPKHLWRGDMLAVKYNLDIVMKAELLLRLLEWKIEVAHNWSIRPGNIGRGLQKLLDRETWAQLGETYVGFDREDNWQALFNTIALFRRTALEVADALGFAYPHALDQRVTAYLEQLKRMT